MSDFRESTEWLRSVGYTEAGIDGVMYSRALSDEDVCAAARDQNSPAWVAMFKHMGPLTNPSWITSRCAEEAYLRDLIDETELDRIMEVG